MKAFMPKRRGRPPKYGTRSKIVAVTLPEDVVSELETIQEDLGWAIVRLVEQRRQRHSGVATPAKPAKERPAAAAHDLAPAELVATGSGESLIVVNSAVVRSIPGVQMIPLSDTEAFLALEPGKGMADLELAVQDQIEALRPGAKAREGMARLLNRLRQWRRDRSLTFHTRTIILVSENKA